MAKPFIERHHYSGSYPASRLAIGLFRQSQTGCDLEGVCVFSVPMNGRAVVKHLGLPANDGVELGRLVLLDTTGFNAESWFVARAFRYLKREKPGVQGVLSYRSEEHTSELQSLMRISSAVFCLKKKKNK